MCGTQCLSKIAKFPSAVSLSTPCRTVLFLLRQDINTRKHTMLRTDKSLRTMERFNYSHILFRATEFAYWMNPIEFLESKSKPDIRSE